jgi:hypothetical protein
MDRRLARFLIAGVVLALVTGGILSLFASSQPDGMERVAIDKGFEETATAHPTRWQVSVTAISPPLLPEWPE